MHDSPCDCNFSLAFSIHTHSKFNKRNQCVQKYAKSTQILNLHALEQLINFYYKFDVRWRGVCAIAKLHVHRTAGGDAGQCLQRVAGDTFVAHAGCSRAMQGRVIEATGTSIFAYSADATSANICINDDRIASGDCREYT